MADLDQLTCKACGKEFCIEQDPQKIWIRPLCNACRYERANEFPLEVKVVRKVVLSNG